METTTHTTGDLIGIYSDLLQYVWEDVEVRLAIEHDEDDESYPTKIYERGQAIYDDAKLWRLLRAAPQMLEYLQGFLEDSRQMADDPDLGRQWDWRLTVKNIEQLLAEIAGK